jgi:hypothetical protein
VRDTLWRQFDLKIGYRKVVRQNQKIVEVQPASGRDCDPGQRPGEVDDDFQHAADYKGQEKSDGFGAGLKNSATLP